MKHLYKYPGALVLLLLIAVQGRGQYSVRTNLLLPVSHMVNAENYGLGFSLGVESVVTPQGVLRVSFHHQNQIISNSKPDYSAIASETAYDYIAKTGFRAGYKRYYKPAESNFLPNGFYIGAFTDLMYAHRILTKQVYTQETGLTEQTPIDKAGLFLGGGLSAGYTFTIGQFIIEPNVGIGLCFNPGSFSGNSTNTFFSNLDPMPMHFSVWHLELHLGWVF
ncbi:MAG: hypothetical protein RBT74_13750 [Tenuifilaceae bacterium]|nr:hypothetical protein [Tenuifilaceae bacterium]